MPAGCRARRPPPTTRTRARCSSKGTVRSLPASRRPGLMRRTRHEPPYPPVAASRERAVGDRAGPAAAARTAAALAPVLAGTGGGRSEEHTSELQSRENLVCRLLLEKKKK